MVQRVRSSQRELTNGISAGQQVSVQRPKEWDHMPVIQFDYAHLSSVNCERGTSENAHDSGYEHRLWHSVCD